MDGFLVVDKPAGVTSHDVVSAVRRLAGQRKVGHTGTLDPFATGVLPVALGEGTKAITFLDESVKKYRAVMRLGGATDTQDCTGLIIRTGDWHGITASAIEDAARSFLGRGKQVPPMYSAIKRDGVPLYKLARKGEEVPREPREIEVYSLVIERIELPEVTFAVNCSRGVYVRTLANDLGERLGCGAHLVGLRRIASGPFSLDQAVSLEKLARDAGEGRLSEQLISISAALAHLQALILTDQGAVRAAHGIAPEAADFEKIPDGGLRPGERARLSRNGRLLAVAENGPAAWPEEGENLRLLRVFNEH